jgi:hypothetical protein
MCVCVCACVLSVCVCLCEAVPALRALSIFFFGIPVYFGAPMRTVGGKIGCVQDRVYLVFKMCALL